MSKEKQIEQLTTYMANFVDYIGKVLPDDVIAKLDELAKYLYEKETITGEEFMNILNREDESAAPAEEKIKE